MFKRKRYPNPICYKTSICRNTISKTDRTILCPSLAQPQSSFIPFHYPYLLPQFPVSWPRDRRSYDDNLNTCCRPFVQTLTPFLYQTVLVILNTTLTAPLQLFYLWSNLTPNFFQALTTPVPWQALVAVMQHNPSVLKLLQNACAVLGILAENSENQIIAGTAGAIQVGSSSLYH